MSGLASTNDLGEKTTSFDELATGLYAYTTAGDSNSGILVGPDGVVVLDAQLRLDPPLRHLVAQLQAKVTV